MRYPTLLFDFDHMLFDSDESERQAYAYTMDQAGLADPDAHFGRYVAINRAMWRAVEAGDIQPGEVRHRRFEVFALDVGTDADPRTMADAFVDGLARFGDLYPGARELLDEVSADATLTMVTNGLSHVQRTRIERLGLDHYFESVIISEEVGVTKPRTEIFDLAADAVGQPDRSGMLMIGDSLTSDVAGGRAFGIDTCWYDRHEAGPPTDGAPTHVARELADIAAIARG